MGVCLPDNESIFQWEDVHTFKKVFVLTDSIRFSLSVIYSLPDVKQKKKKSE